MRGNTITIVMSDKRGKMAKTIPLYQYDYGQKLIIENVDLPDAYEVHFSNELHGESITMIGDSTGVDIPDQFITTGLSIYLWVFLHDGEDDGETEYAGVIPVIKRAFPTDEEPTPEQQSVITQTIAALNAGVETVNAAVEGVENTVNTALAEAKASGEFDGADGQDGQDGADGFSPTITTEQISGGYEITITDVNGTSVVDIMNGTPGADGQDGTPGADGQDGYSPIATVTKVDDTATITITDKNGTKTAQVKDGTDGTDGYSPTASVTKSGDTATISITDKNGTTTAEITDGQDGDPGATPAISIGTVTTLSPGSDATASMDVTDPEHPVLSFGIPEGEPGEVTEAELNAVSESKADIIHDTASGSIATFSDGAENLPMSVTAEIVPVQDLHGYDFPWPAGGGVNKFAISDAIGVATYSAFGLTVDLDATNETVRIHGTPTWGDTTETVTFRSIVVYSGNYGNPPADHDYSGMSIKPFVVSKSSNITLIDRMNISSDGTLTLTLTKTSNQATDITIQVMIYEGSTAPSSFAPYSNICPISGWTGAEITRTGKNLLGFNFDSPKTSGGVEYTLNADGSVTCVGTTTGTSWGPGNTETILLKAGTYKFNLAGATNIRAVMVNASSVPERSITTDGGVFTLEKDTLVYAYIRSLTGDSGVVINERIYIKLEIGSTTTEYEKYQGSTYPITFPVAAGTVYGGSLTVNKDGTGVLTVTHGMYTFTGNEAWTKQGIAPKYYSSGPDGGYLFSDAKLPEDNFDSVPIITSIGHFNRPYNYVQNYTYEICIASDGRCGITEDLYSSSGTCEGIQVFYELATPVTYQLTNQQVIETLKGVNNVWADCGPVSVEYPADTKLYIDKKLTASRNLMELIITANHEDSMKATKAYTTGNLLIVNGTLYKATASIANGATLTVGTNVTATTIANELALLA